MPDFDPTLLGAKPFDPTQAGAKPLSAPSGNFDPIAMGAKPFNPIEMGAKPLSQDQWAGSENAALPGGGAPGFGEAASKVGRMINPPSGNITEAVPGKPLGQAQVDDQGRSYIHTSAGGVDYIDPHDSSKYVSKWDPQAGRYNVFESSHQTRPMTTYERYRSEWGAPPEGTEGPITGYIGSAIRRSQGEVPEPGTEIGEVQKLAPIMPGAPTARPGFVTPREAPELPPPGRKEIKQAGASALDSIRNSGKTESPYDTTQLAQNIASELQHRFRLVSPKTQQAVKELDLSNDIARYQANPEKAPPPPAVETRNLVDLHQLLNTKAFRDSESAPAAAAQKHISDYLESVPEIGQIWKDANQNYSQGKLSQRIGGIGEKATQQQQGADWSYSVDRGIRARIRSLLDQERTRSENGLRPNIPREIQGQMEALNRGNIMDKLVRGAALLDPRRTPWHMSGVGPLIGLAHLMFGPAGSIMTAALAATGALGRAGASARTEGGLRRIDEGIREGTPLADLRKAQQVKPTLAPTGTPFLPPFMFNPATAVPNPWQSQQKQQP